MSFPLAFKSTVDKILIDFANTFDPALPVVDLDDRVNVEEILSSASPALVWELLQMEHDETSGALNTAMFYVGAKTTDDPSNYEILKRVGELRELLKPGTKFDICDYSGEDPGEIIGKMYVTSVPMVPQHSDRISGLRFLNVTAKVVRYDG